MGGYLYFHKCPDSIAFDRECRRLLTDIHYFDVLRSDRSISSHGLEARTPFLDRNFVQYYLSINPNIRNHNISNNCEKYLIRESVNFCDKNLLPKNILYRTKEAFSDGVSKQTKSWYQIIQEHINKNCFLHLEKNVDIVLENYNPYIYNKPKSLEQLYYRNIFQKHFNNYKVEKIIPYFWMPKFIENATDASARTLDIYKDKIKTNV